MLFRVEAAVLPAMPDLPTIFTRATTKADADLLRFVFASTQFGRPYVLPPDVPEERVKTLRAAFDAAVSDPALIAEASAANIDMTPRPAAALVSLIDKLYATPVETIETVKKIIPTGFN